MRKLGVSIYPESSTMEEDKNYLNLVKENGFSRVFTCLLSVSKPKDEVKQEFQEIIAHAKQLGLEVIVDVAPVVFDSFGISYDDLSFFAELGADGVRLDVGFDGLKEAKMTLNPYGLLIELNMSNDIGYLENILSHKPNKDKIVGCHNFYPQRFTGLPYEFFISCSQKFKKQGLRTAAFVSSDSGELGPWSINDGLCTLEEHRNLPIHVQAKHLWATGLIDDVIIGNAYASEAEIVKLGQLNRDLLELEIEFLGDIPALEKQIVLDEVHVRRGDISEYVVRSVAVRKKYKHESILPMLEKQQEPGDIALGNNRFGKYKAELQVVLKAMPLDDRKNIIARVVQQEHFLMEFVDAWSSFALVEYKK